MLGNRFSPGGVSLPSGRLAYHRSGGQKPALLFIHGLGDNGHCWARVAEVFVDEFDVILLDSRGHGSSAMPSNGEADDPASDLCGLLDHLKIDQIVVVGHSVGALAAATFAANHGHRVTKLVLEDPPLRDKPFQPSKKMLDGFGDQMKLLREMKLGEAVSFGRSQHPSWDIAEFDAWAQAKRQVNPQILGRLAFAGWRDVIPQISIPSMLLRGEPGSDSAVSADCAQAVQALNENFCDVVVAGAGHNVRRENFSEYVLRVRTFLVESG